MGCITVRMNTDSKITQRQLDALESLCLLCPKGQYTEKCPFNLLKGVSHPS